MHYALRHHWESRLQNQVCQCVHFGDLQNRMVYRIIILREGKVFAVVIVNTDANLKCSTTLNI